MPRLPVAARASLQALSIEGVVRWIRAPLNWLFEQTTPHLGEIYLGGSRCTLLVRRESAAALTQGPPDDPHFIHTLPVLVIHAHSSCNCRCLMCDIWKTQEQKTFGLCELTPQLDSIRRLGVRWVVFTGGEPLMNAELPSVCAVLRKEGIRLTLLSTGLLLKKCARDVAEYFDDVIVSLDGPPEIHDNIRRVRGAFGLLEEASVQSEKSRTSKLRPVHCSKPIIVILCATARA